MYTGPTTYNTQTENIHPNMHAGFKVDCSIGKGDFQIVLHLNKAQHRQIQTMLDKEKQLECMTNMAGIDFKTLPIVEQVKWIIDTGATNHTTTSLDMLFDGKQVTTTHNGKVHLPNGGITSVPQTEKCKLWDVTVLENVLFISDFKYNL